MKKFLFILFGVFAVAGAFAAGDNTPTSKSYVDAAVAQKQDKISANITSVPTGYTQLRYIESTGTQWIDTLVTLGADFEIYLDAMVSGRADHILLAGGLDVNRYNASLFASGINGVFENGGIEFGGDNNRFYIGISPFWVMHYNGVKYVLVRGYSPSGTLRVFSGTVGRLYNLKIYSGPLLQFNGIPARRNSDNVVGMYDTISGQFFTNSGTGEFVAGPVIVIGNQNQVLTNTGTAGEYGTKGIYDATGEYATQQNNLVDAVTMNTAVQNAIDSEFQCVEWDEHGECLLLNIGSAAMFSSGYTALEYIESTGTQYIDTGHIPTSLTRTEVDLKFTDDTYKSSGGAAIFGVVDSYHIQAIYSINFGGLNTQGTQLYPWLCRTSSSTGCSIETFATNHNAKTTRQTLVLDAKNKVASYGTAKKSLANQTVQSPNASIYLFGQHRFESDGTESALPYSRNDGMFVYAARIYEDDSLVKNLVPARRDSDNRLGLYDTMTGAFLTNSGTGEFIAGPVVNLYLPAGQ